MTFAHLAEAIDGALRRLSGTSRAWRTDRMATVVMGEEVTADHDISSDGAREIHGSRLMFSRLRSDLGLAAVDEELDAVDEAGVV
ncbi:MAG: hypothetical protein JWN32_1498 [Solirubrobacterales bacterium]|nr:hypothetical protein [Solirubrobacterales bacterium]